MNGVKFDASNSPVITAFMQSDARRRYIQGPFGSGKSSACSVEIVRRSGMQPHYTDGYRHSRWLITRNTTPQLRDTTMKTFFRWFPNGSIGEYRSTEKVYYIKMGDVRAEVIFRALDNPDDVSNLLSLDLTGAWMNECREINSDIVDGIDGRIGRWFTQPGAWKGIWADTNPPTEEDWWYFIAEGCDPLTELPVPNNGWESFFQPSGLSDEAENLAYLPDGRQYYVNLMQGKLDNYIRMYVHGRYGRSLSGKPVYPTFDPAIHVAKMPLIGDRNKPLILTFDFGLTPACVFKQQDVVGRALALRELITPEGTTSGLKRFLQDKVKPTLFNEFKDFQVAITGDPSGSSGSQTDESNCEDVFVSEGFSRKIVQFAKNNDPGTRRNATEYFLGRLTEKGPAYLIDPSCRFLRRGMSGGFHYPKLRTKGQTADKPAKNASSHVCEADEYGNIALINGVSATEAVKRRKAWLDKLAAQSNPGYNVRN